MVLASCSSSVSASASEDDGSSTEDESRLRPGMQAYCRFILHGNVRAATVIVVEAGNYQTVVAAPGVCAIAASGGWCTDSTCEGEDGNQEIFRCQCAGTSETCAVVFHSVASDAVVETPLSGYNTFLTTSGKLARPAARSVVTTFYGVAAERTYRISTCSGDGKDTTYFNEVRIAEDTSLFFKNSVIVIPDFLSRAECHTLMDAAEQEIIVRGSSANLKPLERLQICDLSHVAKELSEIILCDRILPFFEQHLPLVSKHLFGRECGLRDMNMTFSPLEPAVNRYITGGVFPVHRDAFSVTVNVLLSEPGSYIGGGTAFWPQDQGDAQGKDASVVLRPRQGACAIFNGEVEHAGRAVESGVRHLYVASFHLN